MLFGWLDPNGVAPVSSALVSCAGVSVGNAERISAATAATFGEAAEVP
jgi:hypothetical protein